MPTPPSDGPVTSAYGPRKLNVPGVGPFHYGSDRTGKGNVAPEAGVIAFAVYSGVFGNIIGVRAGDVVWNIAHHAHLNGRARGQRVAEGEHLAPLGSTGLATGPHSHTERRVGGRDAIQSGTHTDPERYYTAPRPAGEARPHTPDPEETESMSNSTVIVRLNPAGHIFTMGPEFLKHETDSKRAEFIAYVLMPDAKYIEVSQDRFDALCESFAIPASAAETVLRGRGYDLHGAVGVGRAWSRNYDLGQTITRIESQIGDVAKSLQKALSAGSADTPAS